MKSIYSTLFVLNLVTWVLLPVSCSQQDVPLEVSQNNDGEFDYSFLALGDSYTIGESVSSNQSFPAQVVKSIEDVNGVKMRLDIIATTGWRTDDLLKVLENKPENTSYDFVTLLIGVNNQFQGRPFSQYENEFPQLLEKALGFASNDPDRVIVVSIPDYGYTPFARNGEREKITAEIEAYNAFAKNESGLTGVRFVNITDITQRGLDEPDLVADDGLHPSGKAYQLFAERILPFISAQLKD